MNDPCVVRVGQSAREVGPEGSGLPGGQGSLGDARLQRRAVDQLHHQVGTSVVPAGVVDGDQARVPQPGEDHRLVVEAVLPVVTGADAEDLDGHRSLQTQVEATVDVTGATRADDRVQAVAPAQHLCGTPERRQSRLAEPHVISHCFSRCCPQVRLQRGRRTRVPMRCRSTPAPRSSTRSVRLSVCVPGQAFSLVFMVWPVSRSAMVKGSAGRSRSVWVSVHGPDKAGPGGIPEPSADTGGGESAGFWPTSTAKREVDRVRRAGGRSPGGSTCLL